LSAKTYHAKSQHSLQQSQTSGTIFYKEFAITAVTPTDSHPLRLAMGRNTSFFFATRKDPSQGEEGHSLPTDTQKRRIAQVHVGACLPDDAVFLVSEEVSIAG